MPFGVSKHTAPSTMTQTCLRVCVMVGAKQREQKLTSKQACSKQGTIHTEFNKQQPGQPGIILGFLLN